MQAQDIQFEDEVARNPYAPKVWWSYLTYKTDAAPSTRYLIYERALKHLPRSYKLWHAYLQERTQKVENKRPTSKKAQILINTYERALVHMHKMPRIWLNYCELLVSLHRGTVTRKTFDRALQALPITQHKDVWKCYIDWATGFGVPETAVRVYKRYLMYDPAYREDFVGYLMDIGQYEEAARQLSICLDDVHFVSPSGQTEHQMWMKLCDICAKHPESVVNSLKVEAIIRSGIAKFSDEVGRLWCALADYYIRLGQFEKARDVYEEAINSVVTVRDFTIVFDAYVKVEESVLTTKIRFLQENQDEGPESGDAEGEDAADMDDINMRLARVEYLMDKRPLLLNSVVLRQNPHNVHEWHKRAKLYKGDDQKTVLTYVEAVKTVDPALAVGKVGGLWLALARFYEQHDDVENARTILRKATEVPYRTVDELANVWCAWGEMEMRLEAYDKALQVRDVLCSHDSSWPAGAPPTHLVEHRNNAILLGLAVLQQEYYLLFRLLVSTQVMQQAVTEPVLSASRRRAQAAAQGKAQDKHAVDTQVRDVLSSEYVPDSLAVLSCGLTRSLAVIPPFIVYPNPLLHLAGISQAEGLTVADKVHKHTKVWGLYLDLEESLGTVESCRAAYDRVLDLKVRPLRRWRVMLRNRC
jgi:pentatricopeptide repeat protein